MREPSSRSYQRAGPPVPVQRIVLLAARNWRGGRQHFAMPRRADKQSNRQRRYSAQCQPKRRPRHSTTGPGDCCRFRRGRPDNEHRSWCGDDFTSSWLFQLPGRACGTIADDRRFGCVPIAAHPAEHRRASTAHLLRGPHQEHETLVTPTLRNVIATHFHDLISMTLGADATPPRSRPACVRAARLRVAKNDIIDNFDEFRFIDRYFGKTSGGFGVLSSHAVCRRSDLVFQICFCQPAGARASHVERSALRRPPDQRRLICLRL